MGWKATKELTREEAIKLILSRAIDLSNDELSNVLESMGYGDNPDLNYYGYNFYIE